MHRVRWLRLRPESAANLRIELLIRRIRLWAIGGLAVATMLAPSPVIATGDGVSALYVEEGDVALLYEGQLPPAADGDEDGPRDNVLAQRILAAHDRYLSEWGNLPEVDLAAGSNLTLGASSRRVSALQSRLGLEPNGQFDALTAARVQLFRQMHGLPDGSSVDRAMIAALNRGHAHYARILARNLQHAREMPTFLGHRYVLVDLATQQLDMVENDAVVDSMRVVAGRPETPTPIMAGLLRHAVFNPYWNVPPDLVPSRYARRIINGGNAYLSRTGFQVVDQFGPEANVIPTSSVDWRAAERGDTRVFLRQRPGPGNGMGDMKFMFPNALGIYLHDTPSTQLFAEDTRLFSAGCVRLERPEDLGRWLYNGMMPEVGSAPEQIVPLQFPVPIYIGYFTAMPDGDRIEFRDDVYSRDVGSAEIASLN